MWKSFSEKLKGYPERVKVVKVLIENGLSIKEGRIRCNELEIPISEVARVAKVDRRTVVQTIKSVEEDQDLKSIFEHMMSVGHSLEEIAKYIGLGVIEVMPTDARIPGILAKSAIILAERDINIRQALVDDPELSPEPKLVIIAEKKIPGELIPEFLKIKGVDKVSVY